MPSGIEAVAYDRIHHPIRARIWIVLTVAACIWSYLLLLQGETSFYTVNELLAGQVGQVLTLVRPGTLALVVGTLAVGALLLRRVLVEGGRDSFDRLVNLSACWPC